MEIDYLDDSAIKWVKKKKDDNPSTKLKYLNIWDRNPRHNDVSTRISFKKGISMVFLFVIFVAGTLYLSRNLILSGVIGIATLIFLVIAFHDNFYSLTNYALYHFKDYSTFDPFTELLFFFVKGDDKTMFYTNKKDLITVALRIFKVEGMPENISITLNQFIKSLNRLLIPYSYQVVQEPIMSNTLSTQSHSFRTSIYFSVYYDINGILNYTKIERLKNRVIDFSDAMEANFAANFYHFKITLLSGVNLINALRTYALHTDVSSVYKTINHQFSAEHRETKVSILKCAFFCFMIGYTWWLLSSLQMAHHYIVLSLIIEVLIFIFIWWREILFVFTLKNMRNDTTFFMVYPFKHIEFYCFKDASDILYAHFNHKLFFALKSFNLSYASPKLHSNVPICNLDKNLRGLLKQKVNFTNTMLLSPLSYYTFHKEGFQYLNEYTKQWIIYNRKKLNNEQDAKDWLDIRSGVWKVIMIVSLFTLKQLTLLKKRHFTDLKSEMDRNANRLWNTFRMNFKNFDLVTLYDKNLLSGYLCESLKNKFFRLNGTHLNYLLFQGKALVQLTEIASEYKKGIPTQIAAEFNTPLLLENELIIGNTINTEFMEEEVPAGLLIEQAKSLLIVNGTFASRERLAMKLVVELLLATPLTNSIIFDFSGRWSKLMKLCEGSFYENEFLYFKAGVNYSLNPLKSDIPFDQENLEYLDYMFDACALSFKKDKRTMELVQNMILSNPEANFSTLSMQLRNKKEWERSPATHNVIALFDDLTQKDAVFFHSSKPEEQGVITVDEFIAKDKTIIIDLSLSKNYEIQLFVSFLIISKIIHHIRESDERYNKIIVLPHMDLFFNSLFIEQRAHYGKIDKFLEPLIQKGFGFVFLANQAHNLHPNIYNYFHNIIAFKATDKRDISVLKNQLKLDQDFGKGYYSKTRNATYQINFLLGLPEDTALMKREDIYQPFPIKIKAETIERTPLMEDETIMDYMNKQGYDLKSAAQRILDNTRRTIFEKDLGSHYDFIDKVVAFLNAVSEVHHIALHKEDLKKQLKKFIDPKAKMINQDAAERQKIRDELFEILLRQKYIVEDHPKTASGSESLGTTYMVGPHFQEALNDDYQTNRGSRSRVHIEIVEKGSTKAYNLQKVFQDKAERTRVSNEDIYAKNVSKLHYELFRIYNHINKNDYRNALKLEKHFLRNFLEKLYDQLVQQQYPVPSKGNFIDYLIAHLNFPFTKKEFVSLIEECRSLDIREGNLEGIARYTYKMLSEFYNRIQAQVSEV